MPVLSELGNLPQPVVDVLSTMVFTPRPGNAIAVPKTPAHAPPLHPPAQPTIDESTTPIPPQRPDLNHAHQPLEPPQLEPPIDVLDLPDPEISIEDVFGPSIDLEIDEMPEDESDNELQDNDLKVDKKSDRSRDTRPDEPPADEQSNRETLGDVSFIVPEDFQALPRRCRCGYLVRRRVARS